MGVNFTEGRINNFKCPPNKKQIFLWDSDVKGLGLRATPGAKVFIFQGRLNGKSFRFKIGDSRTWLLDAVRKEARRIQSLIDKGIDPRQDKQDQLQKTEDRQQAESCQGITVKEVWDIYIEKRRNAEKNGWGARHYLDHIKISQPGGTPVLKGKRLTKAGPLAALMPLKLSDITQEVIEDWLKTEGKNRGARARLAFSLLRAFLKWCESEKEYRGSIHPNVCSSKLKKEYIPKMKTKDDCLQKEQLQVWFQAVQGLNNKIISAYLQSLLLTGARREELAGLKWEDLNFQWHSMTIHDKVEGERTIPLTPYVSFLLAALPRKNEYVFYSQTAADHKISEPRHAYNRAINVAGIILPSMG